MEDPSLKRRQGIFFFFKYFKIGTGRTPRGKLKIPCGKLDIQLSHAKISIQFRQFIVDQRPGFVEQEWSHLLFCNPRISRSYS